MDKNLDQLKEELDIVKVRFRFAENEVNLKMKEAHILYERKNDLRKRIREIENE